jgi:hypothetical protein
MEFFLNAIWLAAAFGAFAYWRPEKGGARSADGRDGSFLALLALAAALLVLFPVISLTDDLHAEQYPMEDSSRTVLKVRNLVQGGWRDTRSPFMAGLTTALGRAAALHLIWSAVLVLEVHASCPVPLSLHQGRSPPLPA